MQSKQHTSAIDKTRLRKWARDHLAVLVGLAVAAALLVTLIVGGYLGWTWVGVTASTSPAHPQGTDYRPAKTLWDWFQLLIIPVALAVAGYWYNTQQRQRESERALAKQRADLLATYFDRLSDLMLVNYGEENGMIPV